MSSVSQCDEILPGFPSFHVAAGLGFKATAKTSECREKERQLESKGGNKLGVIFSLIRNREDPVSL